MLCPVIDCLTGQDFMPSLTELLRMWVTSTQYSTGRLTRCAEFLGCRDRLRVSLQQRYVMLATSLVARRTGAAVAILSVIFALTHACDRCEKRLGIQDSLPPTLCGQFHRVTFFTLSHILLGRDLLKLFPELRLHITSPSRYGRSFLPPAVLNDFCRIKFRWMSSFPKYWNGLIYH
jgi:hypothetical protein